MSSADFSKVIELDPEYYVAYYFRGKVYADLGETEKAIADLKVVAEQTVDAEYKLLAQEELQQLGAAP